MPTHGSSPWAGSGRHPGLCSVIPIRVDVDVPAVHYRHGGRRPATHDFVDYSNKVVGGPPEPVLGPAIGRTRGPTGFTDRGNDFPAFCSTTSWPGLSGPPIAARCGGGGPDKPGHDGEKIPLSSPTKFSFQRSVNAVGVGRNSGAFGGLCPRRHPAPRHPRACPGDHGRRGGGKRASVL